ncbi:MAG: hypothetical protein QOF02_605 [Blastocatellia bacterium]|nr:hypothetical protein [Blastocatellia bacterium]
MSSEQDQVRQLAERIARRVRESAQQQQASSSDGAARGSELNGELAAMRRSLAELKERLAELEAHIAPEERAARDRSGRQVSAQASYTKTAPEAAAAPPTRSPWLSGMYVPATHPSEEKFGVEEAAVSELVDFFEGSRKCELEPGGKPCDHCSMCNSRGF